jgi:hypothetical protein
MATSGRGSGVVGYNVQVAVDTEHHLIVTHEVTNTGSDRAQLANIASQAKEAREAPKERLSFGASSFLSSRWLIRHLKPHPHIPPAAARAAHAFL